MVDFLLLLKFKNQAVGQKGNVYIFTGVSSPFVGWTKPPGNWDTVLHRWKSGAESWEGAGFGSPSSLQVLSLKCVLPTPHTHPQMQSLSVPGSPAVLVLSAPGTQNKAWEWKGVGGSCRKSLFSSRKENLREEDWWGEEHSKEGLCWFWQG